MLIGEASHLVFCSDRDNLTARGGFCNTDLEKIERPHPQALKLRARQFSDNRREHIVKLGERTLQDIIHARDT